MKENDYFHDLKKVSHKVYTYDDDTCKVTIKEKAVQKETQKNKPGEESVPQLPRLFFI